MLLETLERGMYSSTEPSSITALTLTNGEIRFRALPYIDASPLLKSASARATRLNLLHLIGFQLPSSRIRLEGLASVTNLRLRNRALLIAMAGRRWAGYCKASRSSTFGRSIPTRPTTNLDERSWPRRT
jgi:hypothetical protein